MTELNERIKNIPLPPRMRGMPINDKGFPVPWFVANIDGVPDFRVADQRKLAHAVRNKVCWLCGQPLGKFMAFVIGPMCAINRVSSEPPCHRDCAEYAVKACPFLTQPRMRRNDKDLPELRVDPAGFMIARNPGVTAIWVTLGYQVFRPAAGHDGYLFMLGDPVTVAFYAEGRPAARHEVMTSIITGLPQLREYAELQGHEAVAALDQQIVSALSLLPAQT